MRLVDLVRAAQRISSTSRRSEKVAVLSEVLGSLQPDEAAAAHWLAGELPGGKLGVGYRTLQNLDPPPATEPTLTVDEVDRAHRAIRAEKGPGSTARRLERLTELLRRATAAEQEHLRRLWVAELRQGALESLVLEGLAAATGLPEADVRRAQMLACNLTEVTAAALGEGAAGLARFDLTLFRPVLPMLAQPAESMPEAWSAVDDPILELKLDGARIQVHREGSDVRVFSRRGNDVTAAVPEVVEAASALPVRSAVLDGETLAMTADGKPRPFQTTMRRFGRKGEGQALREELVLSTFFFDLLLLDGQTLLDAPAAERFRAQDSVVPETSAIPRERPADLHAAERFVRRAFDGGHEGAMLKAGNSRYEAGRRGAHWLKIKQAHTVDLVVLAAEWGSGRRRGWLSNLHLGARDGDRFVMLSKTFKGLTDDMLRTQTNALLSLQTQREDHVVHVRPEWVVEVAYSDVQLSPHYPAGLALRFARVKRHRPDKPASSVTPLEHFRDHWARTNGD
ncbi:MAG TPA: ATP-dependent DNA ligase [Myxococcales bacterium LLY-WYZ-16_1]|nr:ATP-dependent DNA ligase [Myxococcales bacterium LLY-WYZ-16_1]